ncbi:MAG: DUF952 domain-containing protein [Pseudomonadota bacterium]
MPAGRALPLLSAYSLDGVRDDRYPGRMTVSENRPSHVYRLATRAEWALAQADGVVPERDIDRADGYMHLSTKEQALETAVRHFAGADDLIALEIEAAPLGDALKYELAPKRCDYFPHLYARLSAAQVLRAVALTREGDAFSFGDAL